MKNTNTAAQVFQNQCATLDSFNQLFNVYIGEGNQKIAAYESCEIMHVSMYGRRRFQSYQSFQNSLNHAKRNITNQR